MSVSKKNRTVQLFGTKRQKFLHCPGTKGQAQHLSKRRDRQGQPVKIRDRTQDGTVQDFDSCPFPSYRTKRDKAEKDVLKQEKDILEQERMF